MSSGRVQSIKSKFENLNSLESLDISATVPTKYRKPSPKFLFKRSSTSIDLPISRIAVANSNNSPDTKPMSAYLRRHNNLDRTTSAETFAVKKRNLIANGQDTLKPLKEIKENVLSRHTNDPVKRSSIKRSPAFRVGDKHLNNNAKKNPNDTKITTAETVTKDVVTTTAKATVVADVPPEFVGKFENFLRRCDIDSKQDLQEPGLTDTLKAFLKQPLPLGPPPKKPPRTFIDSPKQVHKSDDSPNAGSDDEKGNSTKLQQQRHSPVHCSASNEMKQKIDRLEHSLVLKANQKSKSTKITAATTATHTKEKNPFSSSLLNCIPCSSAVIYDTMIIGKNQFDKVATTSKEPSPEKNNALSKSIAASTAAAAVAVATALSSHRQSASRTHSEPIYMEPFAHLKNKTKIINGSNNNTQSSKIFRTSSPTSSHSNINEPKLSSSSLSNGSFDGPESLGSSLTSCTSCIMSADDHSITDLNDIHYMCTSIENKIKSSDSDSISNDNEQQTPLSNTYDEINILVNAAFGQHKSTENVIDAHHLSPTPTNSSAVANAESQQQKTTIKLSRTLTEKRKDYIRRVSAVKQIPDLSNDKSPHQTFKPSVFRTFSIDNTDDTSGGGDYKNDSINDCCSSPKSTTTEQFSDRNGNLHNDNTNIDDVDAGSVTDKPASLNEHDNVSKLFQVCLLIGFNNSTRKAYIKSQFPADEDVPPNIEQLVFPSPNLIKQTRKNQDYSLILTDNNGYHIYGYCRRVLPESCEICLPLAYCVISEVKAPGFYFKVLKEIEIRHGQAEFQTNFLLQNLQMRSIPAAGKFIHMKLPLSPRPKTISTSHHKVTPKRLSLEVNPKWLTESAAQAAFSNCETSTESTAAKTKERAISKSLAQEFEEKKQLNNGAPFDMSLINRSLLGKNNGKFDEIFIRRPNDLRLESTELSDLYQTLGSDLLIIVFSTLLLERKVILYTGNISILSSCVLGLQTLLYPFQWQHTIITTLPESLVDICQAPIPVLAGLLEPTTFDIEDGIVVDLDHRTLVQKCGDETTILPSSLSNSLKFSLGMVDLLDQGKMLSSVLIAEAFLRCFIELFVGYKHTHFDKKLFIESHSSQSYRLFLEWFVETAMFRHFVDQKFTQIEHANKTSASWMVDSNFYDLFDSRILKSENESSSSQQNMEIIMKNCKVINKKAKTFKDRFKDFISSNSS